MLLHLQHLYFVVLFIQPILKILDLAILLGNVIVHISDFRFQRFNLRLFLFQRISEDFLILGFLRLLKIFTQLPNSSVKFIIFTDNEVTSCRSFSFCSVTVLNLVLKLEHSASSILARALDVSSFLLVSSSLLSKSVLLLVNNSIRFSVFMAISFL